MSPSRRQLPLAARPFLPSHSLNILAFDKPAWVHPLDVRFNWRTWAPFGLLWSERLPGPPEARYRPPAPCIEHFAANAMWVVGSPEEGRAHLWRYFHSGVNLRPVAEEG